jgi:hypothetical protein
MQYGDTAVMGMVCMRVAPKPWVNPYLCGTLLKFMKAHCEIQQLITRTKLLYIQQDVTAVKVTTDV